MRAALHAHILLWMQRRKEGKNYTPLKPIPREAAGTEPRQRPRNQKVPKLTGNQYQEDNCYHNAEMGRIWTEMVRPSTKGYAHGGFADYEKLRIAGLARQIQTKLYLHKCSNKYCLQAIKALILESLLAVSTHLGTNHFHVCPRGFRVLLCVAQGRSTCRCMVVEKGDIDETGRSIINHISCRASLNTAHMVHSSILPCVIPVNGFSSPGLRCLSNSTGLAKKYSSRLASRTLVPFFFNATRSGCSAAWMRSLHIEGNVLFVGILV